MIDVLSQTGAAVCLMHMQGTPQTMQDNPTYGNVVEEVFDFLRATRDRLEAAGISRNRICIDPGIGFGKTYEHNLALLANASRLHELGCPLLVGHSRKSFLSRLAGDPEADRLAASLGVSCALAAQGVQILRVHDVAAHRQALQAFNALAARL